MKSIKITDTAHKPLIHLTTVADYKAAKAAKDSGIDFDQVYRDLIRLKGAYSISYLTPEDAEANEAIVVEGIGQQISEGSSVKVESFVADNIIWVRLNWVRHPRVNGTKWRDDSLDLVQAASPSRNKMKRGRKGSNQFVKKY